MSFGPPRNTNVRKGPPRDRPQVPDPLANLPTKPVASRFKSSISKPTTDSSNDAPVELLVEVFSRLWMLEDVCEQEDFVHRFHEKRMTELRERLDTTLSDIKDDQERLQLESQIILLTELERPVMKPLQNISSELASAMGECDGLLNAIEANEDDLDFHHWLSRIYTLQDVMLRASEVLDDISANLMKEPASPLTKPIDTLARLIEIYLDDLDLSGKWLEEGLQRERSRLRDQFLSAVSKP